MEPELEVLVAGGDVDLVVHGEEDVHGGGHDQGVGGHQPQVLGPRHVHLGRGPQERDGRHEGGHQ